MSEAIQGAVPNMQDQDTQNSIYQPTQDILFSRIHIGRTIAWNMNKRTLISAMYYNW
jgi:hypothetical protein